MGKGSERSWSGGSERYSRNPWSPSPFPFFQSFFPWARKGIRNELDSIRPRHTSRPSRLDQLIAFVEFRVPSQKTESQMSPLRRRLASTACLPRSTDHQPQPQLHPNPPPSPASPRLVDGHVMISSIPRSFLRSAVQTASSVRCLHSSSVVRALQPLVYQLMDQHILIHVSVFSAPFRSAGYRTFPHRTFSFILPFIAHSR
jgi:hypothetical protein